MTSRPPSDARDALRAGTWIVQTDHNGLRLILSQGDECAAEATKGSLHAVFAGPLYNRRELIQQLGLDPASDDAGVIVHAYARWDDGLLREVEGACALVVWDGCSERVLAARDPTGLYPLFYAESAGSLILSNSIDALTRQPSVSSAVNLPAIVDHLRHNWNDTGETFHEHVRRIPAGHLLDTSGGKTRVIRYWDPSATNTIDWVGEEEVGLFDGILQRAVERAQGPGRTGVFLSGGLDSVSIAALSSEVSPRSGRPDPLALSLAFPVPEVNEEDVQRRVAAGLGMGQHILQWDDAVGPDGLITSALELCSTMPAPLLNMWMPAYDRLALAGKEHGCEVILTGSGGDEWLTVTPYYAADLLRAFDLGGLVRLYREHHRSFNIPPLLYLRSIAWHFGFKPVLDTTVKRGLDRHAPAVLARRRLRRLERSTAEWIAPGASLRAQLRHRELRCLERESARREQYASVDRRFPRHYVQEMHRALDHPLVSMEVEETFEQGRRLGVPIRHPYWDAQLVEFLYRTPPELLNNGGRSKGLVRKTVAERFPSLGFERQKKVVATSFARRLILAQPAETWKRLGRRSALEAAGVVDGAKMRAHLPSLLDDSAPRTYGFLWDMLVLESWLSTHI